MTEELQSLLVHFNPHSRKGSDISAVEVLEIVQISIHTPARGVTSRKGEGGVM